VDKYIQQTASQMEKILRTSATTGLSMSAAEDAQSRYGKNLVFPDTKTSFGSFLKILLKRISFYVMIVALAFAIFAKQYVEAFVCLGIYLLFLGCFFLLYRYRAKQKRGLYLTASAGVRVIREGSVLIVSPEELVVGDLIDLKMGDILYSEAYVVTDAEMEVFCKRESFHETLIKHGGPCFDDMEESFNVLRPGDVIRGGAGRAFVTSLSHTPPTEEKEDSATESTQKRLCRLAVRLSASLTVLSLLVAVFLTVRSLNPLSLFALCTAVICAVSPAAWCDLLYDCLFLTVNKRLRSDRQAFFTSMNAVEDMAKANCFLLSTKSVFQSSRYVVRAYESGTGVRIAEKSDESTEELSFISSALLKIHRERSGSAYEKYLLDFCKKHASDVYDLKLGTLVASPDNVDVSIASFQNRKDGRAFSFAAGDPESLLPYMLYVSEGGRVRILDELTRTNMLSAVRKLKKDGHRLIAYAETQTRVSGKTFPFLSRDMKLLGFFVLSELPDRRIADALKWMLETGKKAVFLHNGENPEWITDALPLLKSAPIVDGHSEDFYEEMQAFAGDLNLPFAIGVHLSPEQQSQLAHTLEKAGYQTVAYGTAYADHRLMCAANVAVAPFKERKRESVGVVQESARVFAKEHVAAQIGAVKEAEGLVCSFGVSTAYFCASLLARSVLLLFGAIFGSLLLNPITLAVLSSFIDLLAFWCLYHVKSKAEGGENPESVKRRNLGFFLGTLSGAVVIGALSLWISLVPKAFPFSFTALSVGALLLMLNVGVLRFASVRYSLSVVLFPLTSLAACALFLLVESIGTAYPFFVPVFPFWALLPTVILLAVGKCVELGVNRKEQKINSKTKQDKI